MKPENSENKLLLEKISLAGIVPVIGVSNVKIQHQDPELCQ
ncbi:MAG: hypothetical protein O4804_01595 [Trichodesmium sp. St11_bin5]|nr:hypothetical protein [Trichodesmium sp. St11_bin5]